MNIKIENVNEILALYNINGRVSNVFDFIHYFDGKEIKIISKIEFIDRRPLVIKFVKEKRHPSHIIESQSAFSEYLRKKGILTPKRYTSGGKYCISYKFKNIYADITIEDYLNKEVEFIDYRTANLAGQLMGKIHTISESGNCLIGQDTIFNLFGYNEVSGYDTFCEFGEANKINRFMYHKIKELYIEKVNNVKKYWDTLPKFATQGDISINNLAYVGETLGIFDYNIAGDGTLVGDMILEGLLIANEMDLDISLVEDDRVELFKQFYKGYITERVLSDVEKNVLNDVYLISSALWFTKIKYDDNSLETLIENNEQEKIENLLQEIYYSLKRTDIDIFKTNNV